MFKENYKGGKISKKSNNLVWNLIYPIIFKEEQKAGDFIEKVSGENGYLNRRKQVAEENL